MRNPSIDSLVKDFDGLADWFVSQDRGLSSEYILEQCLGMPSGMLTGHCGREGLPSIPHDADDFGRCYRLLKAVPSLRPLFDEAMPKSCTEWGFLVKSWDVLCAEYEKFVSSGVISETWEATFRKCFSFPTLGMFVHNIIYTDGKGHYYAHGWRLPVEGGGEWSTRHQFLIRKLVGKPNPNPIFKDGNFVIFDEDKWSGLTEYAFFFKQSGVDFQWVLFDKAGEE